jgi:hypothetical protein
VAQSGATKLALADEEDQLQPLPLGFAFQFYGQPYTAVSVSPDDFLTFLPGADSGCCGQRVPDATPPNGLVAGLPTSATTSRTSPSAQRAISWSSGVVTTAASRGAPVSKARQARIGRRGSTVLKLKLTRSGRSALDAAPAHQLPVLVDTTVTDQGGATREAMVPAILVGTSARRR